MPGQAKPIQIMGERFTLYRGEGGAPHVVGFRCAHRGTQLSAGWVEGDCIRCILRPPRRLFFFFRQSPERHPADRERRKPLGYDVVRDFSSGLDQCFSPLHAQRLCFPKSLARP